MIIYSCSGCSSAAQMANSIAVAIDRTGVAEMSCIAGVGGGVAPLVVKAKKAGAIAVIDGCSLRCAEQCLKREGLKSTVHYDLSELGVRKAYHQDFSQAERDILLASILEDLKKLKTEAAAA